MRPPPRQHCNAPPQLRQQLLPICSLPPPLLLRPRTCGPLRPAPLLCCNPPRVGSLLKHSTGTPSLLTSDPRPLLPPLLSGPPFCRIPSRPHPLRYPTNPRGLPPNSTIALNARPPMPPPTGNDRTNPTDAMANAPGGHLEWPQHALASSSRNPAPTPPPTPPSTDT